MPRKPKNDKSVDPSLPRIPEDLLKQLVGGPMSAELRAITIEIEHLLAMTSGLDWDEGGLTNVPLSRAAYAASA